MRKGYFSFSEFCRFLLPLSVSGAKLKLIHRYDEFLYRELKNTYPSYTDDSFNLFGHKFGGPNYGETISFINEIMVLDQYHANHFLKSNSIVIDAGANIGTFSILAARLASQGHIYSFEPAAETFRALKRNTESYSQITCENFGLGERASQKNIFVNSRSTGGSVFEDSPHYTGISDGGEGGKLELVRIVAIDDFITEHVVSHVDFIKIDTEGYEAKILQGAKETIKKWKPVIAMSAYHNPNDKKDLPELLKSICPDYICELHKESEEDLICYVN